MTVADTAENLARLIPEVEEMMDTGMIATSDVEYMFGSKSRRLAKLEIRGARRPSCPIGLHGLRR